MVPPALGKRPRIRRPGPSSCAEVVDDWLRTGDIMRTDAVGFLYFVGRNTDSMRRRGENVSAYEVEKLVDAHPAERSAQPSARPPLGEQDIMIAVVPVPGVQLDLEDLERYLAERPPKYAAPSYLEVVNELPKTGTHRVIEAELKKRGVSAAAISLDRA